jgi:hypothetical protein
MSEQLFDCPMGLPHARRAISCQQRLDDGPLDRPVAEPKRLRSLTRGSVAAPLVRKSPEKHRERPQTLANGLSSVHLGALEKPC